uniref:Ubiquitin carboxyl-terminal hydrolase 2 n=1 Tax=Elaeis guineensis var. tenera TaxID=51953 RepID=A0A6I9RHW7_ELAGV|nr:ubiquitin carboxyl-terminal hydrolase 2 [Elaeis guineensis]XP_029121520.1 ubiquitin carboxyl-terminal hydrolase 2 [Elaeis guineensis]
MGKKMKTKARNPRKVQPRASAGSSQPVSEPSDRTVDVGGEEVKGGEQCNHYSKDSAELNRVLLGILSSKNATACEHCREEPVYKRGGKEKGKQQKKKGGARNSEVKSGSHVIWVCLDCSRYFCGGAVNDSVPYGHARRHAKQERHSWAVRFDDPTLSWCFSCNSAFPIEMPEVVADSEDKLVKDDNSKGVENGVESLMLDGVQGHMVRGLTNLGNTCFFNSILQNVFAINKLRDYMLSLNKPVGPLTMAMKKLFVETSGEVDSRSTLSPKSLFSCICSKAPQFRGYDQQDSHELLRCLLDGLHMEEKSAEKSLDSSEEQDNVTLNSRTTIVDTIFGGQLSSTVSCVECGHTSVVHEPFLDLSLPVPSKKPPVPSKKQPLKKVPPPPPKKSKPPLKERNRSRRFREKGSTKESLEMEQNRVESFSSSECTEPCSSASQQEHNVAPRAEEPSECCESCGPSLKSEQHNASKMEDSFCWLDYLEPSMAPDVAYSDSQMHEDSVTQCSETRQIYQSENNAVCTVELQTQNCSKEQLVTPDSCGENSNDVSSSNMQDSCVILLPYKELNPTAEKINGTSPGSQNPEILAPADALVKDSSVQTTSAACNEEAEADFDGFGDLFNEPEVTSELKVDTSTGGEMDATLWTSNSSESNQEEVDDTNSPVSVDSCLVLFTKPELLSDEHAWYCEHCSEVLSHHNVGRRKGKQQYATRLSQSEDTKSHLGGEVGTTKVSLDSEVGCLNSTEIKVLSNGKMASTSVNMDQHVERIDDINATVDVSQKSANPTEGSDNTNCKNVVKNENYLMFSKPMLGDQAQNPDENFVESGPEKSIAQDCSSSKESEACSTKDHQGVGCGESLATACSGSLNHTETILSNSCENGDFGAANPGGKRGSQLLDELHPVEDSRDGEEEPKRIKVKRDATKRILIDRPPPILTIHLKRFSQDARGRLTKLRGHVSFLETLSLRPYMDPRCEEKEKCDYRLIGVVEHTGSMGGGHYVAYIRGQRGVGKAQKATSSPSWFYASDHQIRETSLSEVLKSDAYILFYERV